MKFKLIPTIKSYSNILGHTIKLKNITLKKGKTINQNDINLLTKHKISSIYVGLLKKDDYSENLSAAKIAKHIISKNILEPIVNNGRADLFANKNGMLNINRESLIKINFTYPDVAVCSLKSYTLVKKGQLLGNVKILPYALNKKIIYKILKDNSLKRIFQIIEKKLDKVAVIFTKSNKDYVNNNKILNALNDRLKKFGSKIISENICEHNHTDLCFTLGKLIKEKPQLILIYGETSISDNNDVVPRAIREARGKVLSTILPTDPGNLLLVGKIEKIMVIGVPGCAKSIKRNGFDDVLERVFYGEKFTKKKLASLADGGLYKDIIRKSQIIKKL